MANPQNKQSGKSGSTETPPITNTGTGATGSSTTNTGAGGTGSMTDASSSQTTPTQTSPTTSGPTGSSGITGAATATARSFIDQAKETAGQAYEAVTDKATRKLDEQKSTLTEGLTTVADSVRQVSGNLGSAETDSGLAGAAAKYTDTAARRLEDMAGYFENKSVREMARDLESFARRNPAIFLGAAFGLGLLAARFLKSTAPTGQDFGRGGRFNEPTRGDLSLDTPMSTGGASTQNTSSTPDSVANPL